FVKASFAHRRKTLINSLRDEGYDHRVAAKILSEMGVSPTTRAETLALDQFIALTERMNQGDSRLN
ncbi:MAG TPA: hypothetical protein VNI35_04225, partial [Nitrospira sp.]|nr:hypothetical protein [Nitrospira sp.]